MTLPTVCWRMTFIINQTESLGDSATGNTPCPYQPGTRARDSQPETPTSEKKRQPGLESPETIPGNTESDIQETVNQQKHGSQNHSHRLQRLESVRRAARNP